MGAHASSRSIFKGVDEVATIVVGAVGDVFDPRRRVLAKGGPFPLTEDRVGIVFELVDDSPVDAVVRAVVEDEWCRRFRLDRTALQQPGVHVRVGDLGANDAMSFRLDDTAIVVVRPNVVRAAESATRGRSADDVFTAGLLADLVGPGASVDGPSWHGYVSAATFRGAADPAVKRLCGGETDLLAFLRSSELAEWAESGFSLDPAAEDPAATAFYGIVDGGSLVAAGNLTEWRDTPADVGLLVRPDARGRGLATRVAAAMVVDALPTAGVVRYRALQSNRPSMAIAHRLGFEGHGLNYRARRLT